MRGQVQHPVALRPGQPRGDGDDLATKGRGAGDGMPVSGEGAGGAEQVVGDGGTDRQAPLAAKRPEGRCANAPSVRSANTVSMIACRRWVMSAATVVSVLSTVNSAW